MLIILPFHPQGIISNYKEVFYFQENVSRNKNKIKVLDVYQYTKIKFQNIHLALK